MSKWTCPACGDTLCQEIRGKVIVEISTGMRVAENFDHDDTIHYICEACATTIVQQIQNGEIKHGQR